jgi:hypothetical protein
MSFLIDPPWLYATGRVYARADDRTAAALGAATMAGFWGTSVSLYLNREWTRWIWELCRARDGRDWMLNSGVFRFDRRGSTAVHAVSAAIFATYPVWLWLGWRDGRRKRRA